MMASVTAFQQALYWIFCYFCLLPSLDVMGMFGLDFCCIFFFGSGNFAILSYI